MSPFEQHIYQHHARGVPFAHPLNCHSNAFSGTTMQASLKSSACNMLSCCVRRRPFAPSLPDLLPPSTQSSGPGSELITGQYLRRSTIACPSRAQQQTKTGSWGVLTSSWPSARPSRPLVCRPWLRCQSPNCRIVLRRLVPLRLSCSFFSSNKPPQRLSRALPMENTRARFLSGRVFDVDYQSRSDDDVGWMDCFAGTRLGCAGLRSRVGL